MLLKCVYILVIIYSFNHFITKVEGNCLTAKTCSECISTSLQCYWCEDTNFRHRRCGSNSSLLQLKCPMNKIIGSELRPESVVITDNRFNSQIDETIQLKPQKYRISLRSKSSIEIPIHFRQANDYPMDLYYLIDLSCTMSKFKRKLADVGNTLAQKMKKTTANFRIGFGSFVDKPIMPYTQAKNEQQRCLDNNVDVMGIKGYSFVHQLKLSSNADDFVERVQNAQISGNLDAPEGTLDALMQVLVCKNDIGWRDQADKIVVVATDEEFHYAGDGKLGGILVPNDGLCHMDKNSYTHYHLLDYPSMHHISETVNKNKFNVVFTVAQKVKSKYETLAQIIGSNARVTELQDQNQDKIVELIDKVYKSIRSSVELRVEQMSDYFNIDLYSNCGDKSKVEMKTNNCSFIGKPEITFTARISLKSCPEDKSLFNQKMRIGLTNINESVEIDLKLLCDCDCDQSNRVVHNSPHCSGSGTFACGICAKCNGIRIGDKCECDPDQPINPNDPDSQCRPENRTTVCNNNGNCWCGKCQCSEGYGGDYCQYELSKCKVGKDFTQELCSGNGNCDKEMCICNDKYSGKYCNCLKDNKHCFAPNDNKICSDRGECLCGKCNCLIGRSTGTHCQFCPSCEAQEYCDRIWKCVPKICEQLYDKSNCTESCLQIDGPLVEQLSRSNGTGSSVPFTYECRNRSRDNECDLVFSYERKDDEMGEKISFKLTTVKRHCAEKVNLVVVSGSLFGAIILIGLALLLIWKLITEILDRKEFSRFEREINKAQWGQSENPLYKEVTTTFTNPTFGLREKGLKRLSRLTDRISRRFDFNK